MQERKKKSRRGKEINLSRYFQNFHFCKKGLPFPNREFSESSPLRCPLGESGDGGFFVQELWPYGEKRKKFLRPSLTFSLFFFFSPSRWAPPPAAVSATAPPAAAPPLQCLREGHPRAVCARSSEL